MKLLRKLINLFRKAAIDIGANTAQQSDEAKRKSIEDEIERLLTETDAPYMAPVPHRGERNESSFIPHIIEKMAEAYQVTPDEVARITTDNAKSIFHI